VNTSYGVTPSRCAAVRDDCAWRTPHLQAIPDAERMQLIELAAVEARQAW
jgi:hypothetical protein